MSGSVHDTAALASLVDEAARRRLEAAWRSGTPVPIESCLPAEDHPGYLATLEELVLIELELSWKSWQPPEASASSEILQVPATLPAQLLVETYLQRFPRLNQPEVVRRLVAQEWRVRLRGGQKPSPAEFADRFPGMAPNQGQADATLAGPRSPLDEIPAIPGYEMLSVLGHGGMGVIYKARQLSLNRIVALKMILSGAHAPPEERQRFRREAEAVARLQHPNIVHIHEVGEHGGRPFLSLEFMEGGNLGQKIAGQPQPVQAAADMVEILARAMEAVHRRGIIHRDLKPANVLLARPPEGAEVSPAKADAIWAYGTPKITDFGLAKELEGTAAHTQSGAILGTPSYMAPEQAAGRTKDVGPLADVYALGAILYEMLTGQPPFKEATALDTVLKVMNEEPVPPHKRRVNVPRDLETICLKALAKDPSGRYASAQALADDLGRYRVGEPILARREAWPSRVWRKVRRNPVPVAALVLVLAAGALAAFFLLKGQAAQLTGENAQRLADLQTRFEAGLEAKAWNAEHLLQMEALVVDLQGIDPRKAAAARPRVAQRFIGYINQKLNSPRLLPDDIAHLEDSLSLLESRSADAVPNLRQALAQRLRLWETVFALRAPFGNVAEVFNPADLQAKNLTTKAQALIVPGPSGQAPMHWITVHPCLGNVKIEAEFDSTWLGASEVGVLLDTAKPHGGRISKLAFSPDGAVLASAGYDSAVHLWDTASGELIKTLENSNEGVTCLAFHPDGKLLAAGASKSIRIWNLESSRLEKTLAEPTGPVRSLAWSNDGRLLAGGGDDKKVHLWGTTSFQHQAALDHADGLVLVGFLQGANQLVTVTTGAKAIVTTWDLASQAKQTFPVEFRHGGAHYAFSSEASLLAGLTWNPTLPIWELPSGRPRPSLPGRHSILAFSPDGKVLAKGHHFLTGAPMPITLWEVETGRKVMTLPGHRLDVDALAYAPDGKTLASAGLDGALKLWNLGQGTLRLQFGGQTYAFLLSAPQPTEAGKPGAPPNTLGAALKSGGAVRLHIVRNGVSLRGLDIKLPAGSPTLKLQASHEGNQFSVQIANQPPLLFQDLFATRRPTPGNYGVVLPAETGLLALKASRQALPPPHSPLEQGDGLFARGKYDEALSSYQQQAPSAAGTDLALEAHCKAGLCLLQLQRPDQAAKILEQVAAEPGPRWPLVAACHLWLLRLGQGKADDPETEALFDVVSHRMNELAALIPEEVQLGILQAYEAGDKEYLAVQATNLRKHERAVEVAELFRVPWNQVREMKVGLIHGYWLAGQPEKARATARAVFNHIKSLPRAQHSLEEALVLEDCLWVLRRHGDAAGLLKEVDDLVHDAPGKLRDNPRFVRSLLIERARLHAALKNLVLAEKDLDAALALHPPESLHAYGPYSDACLLKGLLAWERGDQAGAQSWWRRGLFNTWKKDLPASIPGDLIDARAVLNNFILAGRIKDLSDEETRKIMDFVSALGGRGSSTNQLLKAFPLTPAAQRALWQGPRALEWMKKIAWRDLDLVDCLRGPIALAGHQILREAAFLEKLSPEQDSLLWQTTQDLLAAFGDGKISAHQLAQLSRAWKGTSGPLGWAGVAPKLRPELRGPIAWLFAHGCLRRQDKSQAAALWRSSLADSPPNSLLHRLAQAELDRLRE